MSQPPPTPSPEDRALANRRKDLAALEHLGTLLTDPHFHWFCETVLHKARDDAHDLALNTAKSSEERDRACWQHAALKHVCGEAERLHADCQRRVQEAKIT